MKNQLLLIVLCIVTLNLFGQVAIQLSNPSFEGTPRPGSLPSGWYDCGFANETPPDLQPSGAFNVIMSPNHGNTYLGLVTRDNDTCEGVAQRLVSPLESGVCYNFSLDLAKSEFYNSRSRSTNLQANYVEPIKIRIYGGNSYCDKVEKLAESTLIDNIEWQKFQFKFTPTSSYQFFFIEAYYKTPSLFAYNGNILIDNCSKIVPCDGVVDLPVLDPRSSVITRAEEFTGEESQNLEVKEPVKVKSKDIEPEENIISPPDKKIYDEIEAALNRDKKRQQMVLKYNPDFDITKLKVGQKIRMNSVNFLANAYEITDESLPVLDELFAFLMLNDNIVIEVGGHTNGLPPHSYCDKLSNERAREVRDYLVFKGVEKKRIEYKGYGKREPLAPNDTRAGRAKNQRVEIKILSLGR